MSLIIYNIRDMKGGGIVDNGYTKRIRERVLSLEDGTVFVMSDLRILQIHPLFVKV